MQIFLVQLEFEPIRIDIRLPMLFTKAAVAMACCVRVSYALKTVSKLLLPAEFQELSKFPAGVVASDLPVWMIEFKVGMSQDEYHNFCPSWGEGIGSQLNPEVETKLVRFEGSVDVVYDACILYKNLVRVIIPDYGLHNRTDGRKK